MPDISMCDNVKCPVRKWCYRYRAIPDGWQSFCHFEPKSYEHIGTLADQCDHSWSIKGLEHRIRPTEEVDKQIKGE